MSTFQLSTPASAALSCLVVGINYFSPPPAGLKSTKLVMASFSVAKVGVQGVRGVWLRLLRAPPPGPGPPPMVSECDLSLACSPSRSVSSPDRVLQSRPLSIVTGSEMNHLTCF